MNYHAGINRMDRFMKRALLIISTTLSCLGLTGCSWMSQDPCSGKDADLSNPACVVQSKQIYRDNDARWYCIGHLEAKDWSCASSLKEAQTKHDAISKVMQAGLPEYQNANTLPEVPEETSELALAMVALPSKHATSVGIEEPVAVVEAREPLVVAAIEAPMTEVLAETRELTASLVEVVTEPALIDETESTLAKLPTPLRAAAVEAPVAVDEILVAVDPVSPAFEVSTTKTPAIENEDEAPEFAVSSVDSAVESALLDVIAVPATVENVRPILADTQNDAPRIAVEGLAAQVVTTIARPDVATIASEIVIPATEPFPAGTTLAEVYTDHVQRSEQLPAGLQTLGPKGALPSPAVASTSSVRPSDLQVQRNPTPNRANEQIERPTQVEPLVTAVASAAKLNSIPMDPPELDYDSMARPATSGDGTYDYFMDLPSDDFAIQLIAQKSLSSIRTFASTVNLEDPLVLKTQLMKRPLYVLVLDTFNDIQLASDAKRAWMVQYDNGIEPWIRTVGSLQKTMQPIGPMD